MAVEGENLKIVSEFCYFCNLTYTVQRRVTGI